MEYNQYMEQAMETVYDGSKIESTILNQTAKARIQHVNTNGHNFYFAHLEICGRILDGQSDNEKQYRTVDISGRRLQELIEFMKDQGYDLHGIDQFDRSEDIPKIQVRFHLE
jgi:hypothetical protein